MKKALLFLFIVTCFSVSAQIFTVGDTTCIYKKVDYVFTDWPGTQYTYYPIDLDNDNISDIEFNSIHVYCHPTPSGPCSSGFDVQYFKITSTTNTDFIYGPATGTNCMASSLLKNMPYASSLQASQNWTYAASPYVYNNDLYGWPLKFCGNYADTFYVGFKKVLANNDTIFGWILLDSHPPGKLISYAYQHASLISSSFSVSQDSICIGSSLNLNSIGTGYFSGVAVNNNMFNPPMVGNYQIYTSSGCVSTATLNVAVLALPSPQITNSSGPICQGDSLILTGSPANGIYSGAGVSGNTLYTSNIATNIISINYVVSDQHNCTNSTTKTFSVVPLTYTMSTCIGTNFSLPLDLSIDTTYTGSGIFNDYYFDSNVSGVGTIPILFTSTCNKTATLNITVYPNPSTPQIINPITKCCLGDKIHVMGSPPGGSFNATTSQLVFAWSDTLFTEYFLQDVLFSDSNRVIFSYDYYDNNGCGNHAYDTIQVEYAYSPNSPISSCPNTTFSLTGYPNGGVFSGTSIISNIYTVPSTIGYDYGYYNYTYPSGCHATYTLNLFTYDCVGIEENVYSGGKILVYPNPVENIIHLDVVNLNTVNPYVVKIVSIDGKVVKTILMKENNNALDLSELQKGIYFIDATIDNSVYRNKIVIAR